jgi:hypothetical protein
LTDDDITLLIQDDTSLFRFPIKRTGQSSQLSRLSPIIRYSSTLFAIMTFKPRSVRGAAAG